MTRYAQNRWYDVIVLPAPTIEDALTYLGNEDVSQSGSSFECQDIANFMKLSRPPDTQGFEATTLSRREVGQLPLPAR
jgi:hypothetical protein